ncbi:glycosyltransferase family 2 protein [Paenibacillus herberti]|uniref:Glycosyl transferase family 2 n=1 Tax=Paenibacillus herberti TaxID=1619309 RepID=A0A229NW76_9BACL|nr:glycosyltransferase family 2 protein [Paenibacillus herberti]OXM14110.1 glycosyl transferase family 2 [Paenibacillus herberti]
MAKKLKTNRESERNVLVIVPAYNEAAAIPDTIARIQEYAPYADVVVVNDGSTDNTGRLARASGVPVLELSCNLGIGGAVQAGYRYAVEEGYAYAVQIDADGQHDPRELSRMMDAMKRHEADMVVGSRFLEKEGFQSSFARKRGIELLAALVTVLTGRRVTDPTSGYRLCSRKAAELFAREYPTDYPEVEALIQLDNHHGRFVELPVVMQERQGGVSSISPLKSGYYMVKVILAVLIAKTKKKKRDWSFGYER